jgi:hypothetical protein
MEQEHLIIIAVLAVILYMLMKHSSNCNCSSCVNDKVVRSDYGTMPYHIRMEDDVPTSGHIRTRRFATCMDDPSQPGCAGMGHIRVRHSDKYIGAGQHIKQHIRYDSRQGMFNGMFSGAPQHIRTNVCEEGIPC